MIKLFACAALSLTAPVARADAVTVSAAISLKDALADVSKRSETAGEPRFNFGASGQLMGQIKQGAPVDVFISAAAKQVDELIHDGLADAASRTVVASNSLVLIVPHAAAAVRRPETFNDLENAGIRRIAIGEPRTVPAGTYAMETLDTLKLGETLKRRLVYGTNVRQVLDYVEREEVDAGIVYLSDAKASGEKVDVVATADPEWHKPIEYVAVVIRKSANPDAARVFIKSLTSEAAQKVFTAKGFASPPSTQPVADSPDPTSAPTTRAP